MFSFLTLFFVVFPVIVSSQQAGKLTDEVHPTLIVTECTSSKCSPKTKKVVLDANWRWLHNTDGYTNCYDGTSWNSAYCADGVSCAKNCALEGADYAQTYGVFGNSDDTLTLKFKVNSNIGSRVYLMEDESTYKTFNLKNREFTFDVDASQLPCGLNGAVYFVEMPADGGMSATNKAGAKFGTGYCDAQCPNDIKFINGEANVAGTDFSKGGPYGTCCAEFDVWEANQVSEAYTAHVCDNAGGYRCSGSDCDTSCDKSGCDNNPYRVGNTKFYGPGPSFTVNSLKPVRVVTQFITEDGTDKGALTEVKRFFIQDDKKIENPDLQFGVKAGMNSLTEEYCSTAAATYGETYKGAAKGGLKAMGEAFERGMVLTLSLWDDGYANMLWLDSSYPRDAANATAPGVPRGTCPTDSGKPDDVRAKYGDVTVTYSGITYGPIGSTL